MNAVFNQVDFLLRLEAQGLARGAAKAIARGIEDLSRELATKVDLKRFAAKDELQTALARQAVQFGVMPGAGSALAVVSAH